jgi:hypothetical protein
MVDLVTEADEGYSFVNWTGDVDTIEDPDSRITTITMGGDYSITATFHEWTPLESTPMVAAGDAHTVGLKSDGTAVVAGIETELAKWDLF